MKIAITLSALSLAAALSACATLPASGPLPTPKAGQAVFSDIRLDSQRPGLAKPTMPRLGPQYENPILPGYYPDPSITRVGDDYYLVNSSFAYYPGIPVFHSRDLVNWTQIGNAIDRPGMLDFSGLATSRGVFAPDITHHGDTFYILNTCVDCKGNFLITAKSAAGPWSDPIWLPFGGIDPSLFWDDDGRAWIVYNDAPEGTPLYDGHRAIWLQEFDPKTNTLTGPRRVVVNGGVDISKKPVWIEGPHIYKTGGHYYLMAAEGGTSVNHSEVILRADSVTGPYLPWSGNPILTQRDLDPARPAPITSAGHADLVQTPAGDWYAVFLATQPYTGDLYNTGRETFLLPVTWTDGWPVILPHGQAIPRMVDWPKLSAQTSETQTSETQTSSPQTPEAKTETHYTRFSHHYGYSYAVQAPLDWLQIRTPKTPFLEVFDTATVGLTALPEAFGDLSSHPAFIGLRQRHNEATFRTTLSYTPQAEGDRAGILALQNDNFFLFFGLTLRDGQKRLEVTRRAGPTDPRDGVVVASIPAPTGKVSLTADFKDGKATFRSGDTVVTADVDATNLSTAKAGGFVGTVIGLYAFGAK